MKRLFFSLCLSVFGSTFIQAQVIELPKNCRKILKTEFRSWQLAEIDREIVEYFKRERRFEEPNLVKGDWNGDGKTDYAVLLQNKNNAAKRITVVFMRNKNSGYNTYVLDADDCLMSVKKGGKYYNFETRKSFRYRTDAIFSYVWEKAGVSYVWQNGRFRAIVTSD